jgi:iron complex transport system substrate-binding protein
MAREIDQITGEIVDAAYKLHAGLGPGLLESVYEAVLERELKRRGFTVARQMDVSFDFDGMHFDEGLRLDLLVDDRVIVELKSVETLARVHFKQLLTYLRLMDLPVGLLINFGGATLKEGLHRVVNGYIPPSAEASPLRVNQARPADAQNEQSSRAADDVGEIP